MLANSWQHAWDARSQGALEDIAYSELKVPRKTFLFAFFAEA